MPIQVVLLPLFVQVILTFALGFWAAGLRFAAVRSGEARPRDIALRQPNWPPRVLQVIHSYESQLELPVLFYVLTILAIQTRHADVLFVICAWIFVVLRIIHAYVHVTSNDLRRRAVLFLAGAVVLAVMWLIFIVRILLALG
jgi:hypothetical protein